MARDLSRSLAILIGNGTFTDQKRLPKLPAAGCVAAMADLLGGELCGWPSDRILTLQDVASPSDLARRVVPAVRDVHEVLLVYYVGHGVRTSEGQLALAMGETDAGLEALPHTAMLYENLAKILRGSPAATKLVILDCCHAELANKANFQSADLAETYPVDGLYFIGASKTHEKAKFDPLGGLTYFTEAFLETVRTGIDGLPEDLRLDQVFLEMRARLVRDGLPEPVDAGIRGARQYPFAANARHRDRAPTAATAGPASAARLRLFGLAEQEAAAIDEAWITSPAHRRATALLRVAGALVADDTDRARRLAARAIQLLPASKSARREAVLGLALVDPDRAYRIADTLDAADRDQILAEVSGKLATGQTDQATRFAEAVVDDKRRYNALAELAKNIAQQDPDLAQRIANTLPEPSGRASVLADIAKAVAESDFPRAKSICEAIVALDQAWALKYPAGKMASVDPATTESFVRLMDQQPRHGRDQSGRDRDRDGVYAAVAEGYAKHDGREVERVLRLIVDPRRKATAGYFAAWFLAEAGERDVAARVARAIDAPADRCSALCEVAYQGSPPYPDDALELLREAAQAAQRCQESKRDRTLKDVAEKAAALDITYATSLARRIEEAGDRDECLSSIARTAASSDTHRAEQIAQGLSPYWRVYTLTHLAWHWQQANDRSAARRALETAQSSVGGIVGLARRASSLARMSAAAAPTDSSWAGRLLDQAEAVAYTIEGEGLFGFKDDDRVLKEIVYQIVLRSPREARLVLDRHVERIARAIPDEDMQADALRALARVVFADDSDRAERLVLGINHAEHRIEALLEIAALHQDAP